MAKEVFLCRRTWWRSPLKSKKIIIDNGGIVLFAQYNDEIVGTVALMYLEDENCFELTKMAVSPDYRGNKIGQIILENCIKKAKEMGLNKVILYSNRVLENAIHIYKKNGFVEIPVECGSPYKRADIKMELKLWRITKPFPLEH